MELHNQQKKQEKEQNPGTNYHNDDNIICYKT